MTLLALRHRVASAISGSTIRSNFVGSSTGIVAASWS
jgi:hypothetical protein